MHNADAWGRLVPIIIGALPADIDRRAAALDDLLNVLPPAWPHCKKVVELRHHLNRHMNAQRELALGNGRPS